MLKGFTAGYFSGIATAVFFVLTTSTILGELSEFDEFQEWKAEKDANTVDGTAREVPQAT